MKNLVGCVALAVMLMAGPVAAEEEEAIAGVGAAAVTAVQQEKGAVAPTTRAEPEATTQPKDAALATAAPAAAPEGMAPAGAPAEPAAAPPPPPPPPITLVLKADLGAQRLTVIENGKAKYTWLISSGRRGYATPTGTFRPQWASRMWHSRQYEWAPMPHAVFFHRGTAFHGTSATRLLGSPASHGCVRLAPGNAAQLFALVHRHGYASTKVVVHNGARGKGPAVAGRSRGRSHGEVASARSGQRHGYRVSRYSNRF